MKLAHYEEKALHPAGKFFQPASETEIKLFI